MGCVIFLLVVLIVLLFPGIGLLGLFVGGGALYGIYEVFSSSGFILFFVIVCGVWALVLFHAHKGEDKFLDEQATLFASKDNDEDRAKVVRAYLLRKNRMDRALNTGKLRSSEISFDEAQAILEAKAEELEGYRKYAHEWPDEIRRKSLGEVDKAGDD